MREFEEFYAATQRRVLRGVALVAATDEDARDCVQEAFIRAASRWPSLRPETAEAWVRRVALNLALDGHRRRGARRRLVVALGAPPTVAAPNTRMVEVVAAVRTLPRVQQEAVVLHYLLDMPVAAVARELDRPENTVKTQLARARARLAELLTDDLELTHD